MIAWFSYMRGACYTEAMSYQIGMDIGGSKYHFRAQTDRGRLVDVVVPAKGLLTSLESKKLVAEMDAGVKRLMRTLKTREVPTGVAIGLAGLDSSEMTRVVSRALMQKRWWKDVDPNKRLLVNDVIIGLRAGTDRAAAIAIVSGTGSNGYGIDPRGDEAWVSGRGPLMADEGSAYEIGVACLRAVRKAEDGRGPATHLQAMVLKKFQVSSTAQLVPLMHQSAFDRQHVAELAILVMEASLKGDKVAEAIIDVAANELALMAKTLHKQLHFGEDKVDVVMVGGCINKNVELRRLFLRAMKKESWANPIPLLDDPVSGALQLLHF
ncbi:hypothetical protein COV06_00675 [Candidatus Uhrbacteria bacterium CG10_big_fil_rev_8_21_14_0_10_50_16]|uniref:ATPase BadF/BadG/BcrA/BcrD type domain-containing protein n=1 Tax=Candidatus Uhrbacteria bacterium CG10_big_fil_rev_8_21_14_0_10_50_16 TaxID=1975039 RepID=A0A2H0RMW9_9BACT|nr:MAG: hypothetical protein COV06_00675 [Candidatus Uhrbacteria bacterium CG10_big_fil_rev_8_21_14_0_10_50_16]